MIASLTEEQIKAMAHLAPVGVFDDFECAVIELAAAFSRGESVSDELWRAVAAHLTTTQMVQLTLTLTWYLSGARMMRLLELDLEEDYQPPMMVDHRSS